MDVQDLQKSLRAETLAKYREKSRLFRERHPDKLKEIKKRDYQKNKARYQAYNRMWREKNKEKAALYAKEYREKYPEKIKLYRYLRNKDLRLKLMSLLGSNQCVMCGFSDERALQIDHIKGGGSKEFKDIFKKGKSSLYKFYIKNPALAKERLQILCANCNWLKRASRGE